MNPWALFAIAASNFSPLEAAVIVEAHAIIVDVNFQTMVFGSITTNPAIARINGRQIQYEPDLPASGMTLASPGDDGFILGNQAFSSKGEEVRTVLHELYRLATMHVAQTGITQEIATDSTQTAFTFANRAYEFLNGRNLL